MPPCEIIPDPKWPPMGRPATPHVTHGYAVCARPVAITIGWGPASASPRKRDRAPAPRGRPSTGVRQTANLIGSSASP